MSAVMPPCSRCGGRYLSYDYVRDGDTGELVCVFCAHPAKKADERERR